MDCERKRGVSQLSSLLGIGVRAGLAVALAVLIPCGASAVSAGETVGEYRPMPLMGGGYSNKKLGENRWSVRGFSVEDPAGDRSMHLALYRGALIQRLQGFAFMQVVNALQSKLWHMGTYSNSSSTFVIVGQPTAEVPLRCEAKGRFAELCRTLSVDDAISTFGGLLGKSASQISSDYDNLKSNPPKGFTSLKSPS